MDEPPVQPDVGENIGAIRRRILEVEGVSDTWIEWEADKLGEWISVLVVEVTFSTDASSWSLSSRAIAEIEEAIESTAVVTVNRLRIVPRRPS